MGNQPETKQKLLKILDILTEYTDDSHSITIKEIQQFLKLEGIPCEERSILAHIKELAKFNYSIEALGCKPNSGKIEKVPEDSWMYGRRVPQDYKFALTERDFELYELKILSNAIISSKFITTTKTNELIDKFKKLTSKYNRDKLIGNVNIAQIAKTKNEDIFLNSSTIDEAILKDKKISFEYYSYNMDKDFVHYPNKKPELIVSPLVLGWVQDNYYCLAINYEDYIVPYRIDRMKKVEILETKREDYTTSKNIKEDISLDEYIKNQFFMSNGELRTIIIKFKKDYINAVIDKFGEDVNLTKIDNDNFEINIRAWASKGFFSWLLQFGEGAELISPEDLRKQFIEKINKLRNIYNIEE